MRRLAVFVLTLLLASSARASVQCDGIDDRLTASGVTIGTTFTLVAWIYPIPTSSTFGTLLADACNGGLWYRGNTLQRFTFSSPGGPGMNSSTVMPENQWHAVAVAISAGTGALYTDGVADSAVTSGFVGTTLLRVCDDGCSELFHGRIGALSVYSVALSANELASLGSWRQLYPGLTRQPLAAWTFDQCPSGGVGNALGFVDRSGNGNTLTGDDGANNTGLTCTGDMPYPWGVQ
jgi:Concanavalin A-like lectin/glucanases superfamily